MNLGHWIYYGWLRLDCRGREMTAGQKRRWRNGAPLPTARKVTGEHENGPRGPWFGTGMAWEERGGNGDLTTDENKGGDGSRMASSSKKRTTGTCKRWRRDMSDRGQEEKEKWSREVRYRVEKLGSSFGSTGKHRSSRLINNGGG